MKNILLEGQIIPQAAIFPYTHFYLDSQTKYSQFLVFDSFEALYIVPCPKFVSAHFNVKFYYTF